MDLLYSRYSNPMEFMRLYIEQGRFGEFVTEVIAQENKRRKEQAEKEDEERLWSAYIHSYTDKSFVEWKAAILPPVRHTYGSTGKHDDEMTKADINNLLNRLFPSK